MADIKNRVGFDIVKTLKNNIDDNIKSASQKCDHLKDKDPECEVCKSNKKIDPEKKEILKNIIEYAIDFGKNRSDVSIEAIIHECKNHPGLKFEKVEKFINNKKFKDLISSKLEKIEKEKPNNPIISLQNGEGYFMPSLEERHLGEQCYRLAMKRIESELTSLEGLRKWLDVEGKFELGEG